MKCYLATITKIISTKEKIPMDRDGGESRHKNPKITVHARAIKYGCCSIRSVQNKNIKKSMQ